MATVGKVYHGDRTNIIFPLDLYTDLQQTCSTHGLEKEIGFILAGHEINPRNFFVTDFRGFEGDGSSISLSGRVFIDDVLLALLRRATPVDVNYGLETPQTELLTLGDLPIDVVRSKKILGGSHTHPQGYGANLSQIDITNIRRYIEFAKKYPRLHASNYGNMEVVIEPKRLPKDNLVKPHSVTEDITEEINLVVVSDIREVLAREFNK